MTKNSEKLSSPDCQVPNPTSKRGSERLIICHWTWSVCVCSLWPKNEHSPKVDIEEPLLHRRLDQIVTAGNRFSNSNDERHRRSYTSCWNAWHETSHIEQTTRYWKRYRQSMTAKSKQQATVKIIHNQMNEHKSAFVSHQPWLCFYLSSWQHARRKDTLLNQRKKTARNCSLSPPTSRTNREKTASC